MRLLTLLAALTIGSAALSHDAPSGWAYSAACCSGYDCAEVKLATVKPTPEGWQITLEPGDHPMIDASFTELVPYKDKRIKESGDEMFHACIVAYRRGTPQASPPKLRCLYVPPMGA